MRIAEQKLYKYKSEIASRHFAKLNKIEDDNPENGGI